MGLGTFDATCTTSEPAADDDANADVAIRAGANGITDRVFEVDTAVGSTKIAFGFAR